MNRLRLNQDGGISHYYQICNASLVDYEKRKCIEVVFRTWFLLLDHLLNHSGDDVSQLIRGADDTPAVALVTLLLLAVVLAYRLSDAGEAEPLANAGHSGTEFKDARYLSTSKSQSW